MDIGYKTSSGEFSLRSAALIIHENKLLVAKSEAYDCYYTVGGGIQENEASDKAVLRECYEETGIHFEIDRLLFVQERFYKLKDICHHEVVFFYLMKGKDVELNEGINTDQQNERLYWIPIEDLENINLVPDFLKMALKNIPKEIEHVLSYE